MHESENIAKFKSLSGEKNVQGAFGISGTVEKYEFSALFLKLPSKSAIDQGKISKLSIWDTAVMERTNNFIGSCIVNYDRGWDIRPSKVAAPYYNKVKTLLDDSAEQYIKRRFHR